MRQEDLRAAALGITEKSGLRRGFCTKCGSTLFSERKSRNVVGVSLGTLDNPERFDPTCHIWMSSKQP
ncbi:MAG TPA: hypothetical protein DD666_11695 [Advenella kashmirensis]|uniref:CENP-V/GFA domain-containing protein n=2 Tax=Advenella TaxID=290425 RepID=A0A356LGG1_9BURK|nr:hypothetical protein [Advenella kashmirensis]